MKITQMRAIERRIPNTEETFAATATAIGVSGSAVGKIARAMGHRRQAIKRLKFKVRTQQALLSERTRPA